MAKPEPDAAAGRLAAAGHGRPAVGTPMSWPEQLTMAPPLLPGLMAASVWIAATSSAARVVLRGDLDGTVQRADDAGGDRAGQPERRADHHVRLADLTTEDDEPIAMTWSLRGDIDLEHGEVGLRVPADDRRGRGLPVGELHLHRPAVGGYRDDVVVGQDVAVGLG